jgi:hypothetical protein
MVDGGGIGPKSLLVASTVQSPEKFGASAAAQSAAVAVIARTTVMIVFINSLLNGLFKMVDQRMSVL